MGHFSKAEHVVVQIGGRGIAELRSNPGQDRKNSPRSSHPSPQKCCIQRDFEAEKCGTKILGAKSATFPRPNASWSGSVGVELRSFAPTRGRIARTRRDLAIRHRRSAASTADQGLEQRSSSQNTRRKVGHFSKAEHVVVRIGGRGIAEFRSNPGQDSKISPRSSHPSPQRCCIQERAPRSRPAAAQRVTGSHAQSAVLFQGPTRRDADRWASNHGIALQIERSRRDLATVTAAVLHPRRFSIFRMYAYDLRRPGSALKDNGTLPLVEGKTVPNSS